jgi:hypothetical protein
MTHQRTTKFWIESWVAAASGLLCVITFIRQDWVELVFDVEPDRGSGALEWSIVGGLVALCLVSAVLARLEWRRTLTLTSTQRH